MSDTVILSPTQAAAALGIEVLDLALNLRRAAAESFSSIASDIERGHPLNDYAVQRARNLVAAAEACDEVWEQDNLVSEEDV